MIFRAVALAALLLTLPIAAHAQDASGLCRATTVSTNGQYVRITVTDPVAIAGLDTNKGQDANVTKIPCPGGTVSLTTPAPSPTLSAVVNGSPTQLALGAGLSIGPDGKLAASGTAPVTTTTCSTTQTLAAGNIYNLTLTGNCALTLANATAGAGYGQSVTVTLQQDSTAGRVPVLPPGVRWLGGLTPTPNSAAGKIDVFTFRTFDGGATWYGGN